MNIILYIGTLVTLAVIDSAWLLSTAGLYRKWLGHLFSPTISFIPAILFYLLYTFGVMFFVIMPAIRSGTSWVSILLAGALFGAVAYGTYDLTNAAVMKDWPVIVTILDILWGMILTAVSSLVVVSLYNHFK